MHPDDPRPPEVREFHAAWRNNDVPALIDLIFRTPTGWTIIALVLTLIALGLVLAGVFDTRPPDAQVGNARYEREIIQLDPQRPDCRNCPPMPATPMQTWVTTDDYPSSAQRQGEEGTTTATLTIGTSGRVIRCAVTQNSGSAALDRAACAALSARARYYPATDDSGTNIEAAVTRRVRWVLPAE